MNTGLGWKHRRSDGSITYTTTVRKNPVIEIPKNVNHRNLLIIAISGPKPEDYDTPDLETLIKYIDLIYDLKEWELHFTKIGGPGKFIKAIEIFPETAIKIHSQNKRRKPTPAKIAAFLGVDSTPKKPDLEPKKPKPTTAQSPTPTPHLPAPVPPPPKKPVYLGKTTNHDLTKIGRHRKEFAEKALKDREQTTFTLSIPDKPSELARIFYKKTEIVFNDDQDLEHKMLFGILHETSKGKTKVSDQTIEDYMYGEDAEEPNMQEHSRIYTSLKSIMKEYEPASAKQLTYKPRQGHSVKIPVTIETPDTPAPGRTRAPG